MQLRDIILLPGLRPDARALSRLRSLLPAAKVVHWIEPSSGDSIASYAARLGATIESSPGAVLAGVSFGGIVAQDLADHIRASSCVVISSAVDRSELPMELRVLGSIPPSVGGAAIRFGARALRSRVFSWPTPQTAKLRAVPSERLGWYEWAIGALSRWRPPTLRIRPLRVHGGRDRTFGVASGPADLEFPDGGHCVSVSHASRIAELIRSLSVSR